jgi:hypothetical protein
MHACQPRCHPIARRGRVALAAFFALLGSCKNSAPAPTYAPVDASPESAGPAPSATAQAVESGLSREQIQGFVNPAHLPPYQGPTGSIEGTITIKGDPPPDSKGRDYAKCPAGELAYSKLFREGPPRADGSRPLADALVAVTGYSGAYIPETRPARVVAIEDCALTSRAIDVTIGQPLEVVNKMKDKIFAPSFLQQPSPVALVAAPQGDPVRLYPQAPHPYTLYDRFGSGSSYLTGDVYVLVQPLHAVTDLEGHYRIDGVPVGKLKVSALLGVVQRQAETTVEVTPNVVQKVDLELTYTAPAPPPNLAPYASSKHSEPQRKSGLDKIFK